jgi:hypothetical protein
MWFIISIIVLVLAILSVLGWFIYTINEYQARIDRED